MPLIPYTVPELEPGTTGTVFHELLSGSAAEGASVNRLERAFAEYVGTKYAVSFASARGALHAAYRFFVNPGQTILLPSYTCIPAIDAARWAGATPEFLDIDLNSYNPVLPARARHRANVGAVSLSYLYGFIGDLGPFLEYARDAGVPLVEDAAIALGGAYRGKNAGAIGDAAVFSLQESKMITAWRGGIVTTSNKELHAFLRERQQGQRSLPIPKLAFNLSFSCARRLCSTPRRYPLTMYPLKRLMTTGRLAPILGKIMNFNPLESIDGKSPDAMPETDNVRLANVQASVALASLRQIGRIVNHRRRLARVLAEDLPETVVFPQEPRGIRHAYGRFPVRIPGRSKFPLHRELLRKGVETSVNYPYICPETEHMRPYGFRASDYPNAVTAARETLLLPCHTRLSEQDAVAMAAAVKACVT